MFKCLCAGPLSSTATSSVSSTTTSSVSTSTTTTHCCNPTTATAAVHCYSSNNRQVRLNLCKMIPTSLWTISIFVCRTYCVCSSTTATNSCYRGEDSGERETPGNKLSLTIEEVKFELQMGFGTGLAMAAGVMIGEAIADGEHHHHHHHHGRHHQHHRHGHHHHHHGRHHHWNIKNSKII